MDQRAHAARTGEAAHPRHVRLHDIDGSSPDQLPESEHAELALPGSHGDALPRANALVAIQIVRRHGLFDPCDIQRFELPAHRDGRCGVVGAVDIQHDVHPGSHRLANRLHR